MMQISQPTIKTASTFNDKKGTMIRLQNVEKVYRTDTIETLALNNINLNIAKGEFLSIMGPSGCGKSTLLNIMGLLDAASKGHVQIDGQDTTNLSDKAMAQFRN